MDWHGLAWTGMDWHGLAWTGMDYFNNLGMDGRTDGRTLVLVKSLSRLKILLNYSQDQKIDKIKDSFLVTIILK